MSIRSRLVLALLLGFLAGSAAADGLSSSMSPQLGGGISQFDGGISGVVSTAAPAGCNGTINLSTGCAMPMLGGL